MLKIAILFCLLLFVSHISKAQVTNNTAVQKEVAYPYKINYSAEFEPIDAQKGKMILDLWKDFEANQLDKWKDKLADTVAMWFPTIQMRAGRDTIIARAKGYRNSYKSVVRKVDVVMSTRSTDKKTDFVLIWGKETFKNQQNKSESIELHEVWAFDKNGKIETIEQYIRK
ncbi:MAG: hypothetical protein ABIN95_13480 [Mucilaginibacter sp.]